MRLLELTIHETRGIRRLILQPQGKNFVIWGANGSGKSGVVDAVDFLLTGKIRRLRGEGTGKVTLKQHGHHVLGTPEEAFVSGVFDIEGKQVSIRRNLTAPNTPLLDPNTPETRRHLHRIRSGQHILTRRDLLHFIAADAGTRAQRMKELLDLGSVDSTRGALVSATHKLETSDKASRDAFMRVRGGFAPLVGSSDTSSANVLATINLDRATLNGKPFASLEGVATLKDELQPPQGLIQTKQPSKRELEQVKLAIEAETSAESRQANDSKFQRLLEIANALQQDPLLLQHFRRRDLLSRGRLLLGDTTRCPLCESEFAPGELQTHLDHLLAEVDETQKLIDEARALSTSLSTAIARLQASLSHFDSALEAVPKPTTTEIRKELKAWHQRLSTVSVLLERGVDLLKPEDVKQLEESRTETFSQLETAITAHDILAAGAPHTSPEQLAWDRLTQFEQMLAIVRPAQAAWYKERRAHQRAEALLRYFDEAQQDVLEKLYAAISTRFEDLYRRLHGDDENKFSAGILQKGSSLELQVDFYGQGRHPPQALHSEGHQDSMGICLFLALAEGLSGDDLSPLLLDDVVMSVDKRHRRDLARLLADAFPETQFLITTHDRTWAEQLRTEGLVTRSNMMHFYAWDLESGPHTLPHQEAWEVIEKDLATGDVPRAAATLRRTLEELFRHICHNLEAPVRFSITGHWVLGDFAPAAVSRLRELIATAKDAANSWGDSPRVTDIGKVGKTFSEAVTRTQVESWAVNQNVHYNAWVDFDENDFRPVVKAFADLIDLFKCSRCGTYLRTVGSDGGYTSLRCKCGEVNWSLDRR